MSRIGLLECDHVANRYRDDVGDYRELFPALFSGLEFEFFDVINGHFPASVKDCAVYMATGSMHSVYEPIAWIDEVKQFIREIYTGGQKYVGICFGHQLLGEALGGRVAKAPVGWCIGAHSFQIKEKASWMDPFQDHFNVLMMCQDQIIELPEGAQILAISDDCPNGLFQVGPNMLGIQGHPEFTKIYDRRLMEDRVEKMGAEKVKKGLESLALPIHAHLLANWIKNFINSQ